VLTWHFRIPIVATCVYETDAGCRRDDITRNIVLSFEASCSTLTTVGSRSTTDSVHGGKPAGTPRADNWNPDVVVAAVEMDAYINLQIWKTQQKRIDFHRADRDTLHPQFHFAHRESDNTLNRIKWTSTLIQSKCLSCAHSPITFWHQSFLWFPKSSPLSKEYYFCLTAFIIWFHCFRMNINFRSNLFMYSLWRRA